jgi:hypothetical protein
MEVKVVWRIGDMQQDGSLAITIPLGVKNSRR